MTDDEKLKSSRVRKNIDEQIHAEKRKIWQSLLKNYEMVEGAHLSNGFIILLALSEAKEPLSSSDISKVIALHSEGQIYRPASTLKDSLENRLKREGFVESAELGHKSRYAISPKGKQLLKGWISFISVYST